MNRLESVLEELAHDAPRPTPHPELWDRGRQLRRRDRVVRSGLVLVVVLLVGGLASFVTARPALVAPAGDVVPDGAIPSRVQDVSSADLAPEGDLATGRASLAFISTGGTMVVSATDGAYHRVELPDQSSSSRALRLSPDGTHLAYLFADRPDGRPDMVAGVAVVDLASGDIARVAAINEAGTTVDIASISWSPDSRWLAWSGYDVVSWGDMGPVRDTSGTVGVVDTDAMAQSTLGDLSGAVGATGVSDDGVATVVSRDALVTYHSASSGAKQEPLRSRSDVFAGGEVSDRAITSADGSLTAVGLTVMADAAPFVTQEGRILQRTLAEDLYPQGGRTTPLGWAGPSLLVGMVEPRPESGAYGGDAASLVLMTSPDRPEAGWTYRYLVRDLPDIAEVSVAVDLVPDLDGTSSQRLTHDFGSYDVGLPAEVRWTGTALAALGVLLAAYALWRSERRRS